MAGQQGGGGGGGQNTHSTYLWALVAITILLIAVWFIAHSYLVSFFYSVKSAELSLIGLFSSSGDALKQTMAGTPSADVTFSQLVQLCNDVGVYLRIPLALSLFALAVVIYIYQPTSRYKTIYDMETLLQAEKEQWPQITPVADKDLVAVNCEEGDWAMAMTPMQFAKKNGLLKLTKEELKEDKLAKETVYKYGIEKGLAARIFSMQLGKPWISIDELAPHNKALFAIFAAKAYRDRQVANALLAQLSASSRGALDYTGIDELLAKHRNQPDVVIACNAHAYEATVMIAMLQLARTDGVLASAEFLWLKTLDRRMWYILNTVGRQTAVPEVAGIYSHWKAESAIGRPLKIPMTQQATIALELAVQDVKYNPKKDLHGEV